MYNLCIILGRRRFLDEIRTRLSRCSCALAVPGAATAAQQPTVQQQFDAADGGARCAQLAGRPAPSRRARSPRPGNPRTLGLIRVRRGRASWSALGRLEEAAGAITLGLPALPSRRSDAHRATGSRPCSVLARSPSMSSIIPRRFRNYRLADAFGRVARGGAAAAPARHDPDAIVHRCRGGACRRRRSLADRRRGRRRQSRARPANSTRLRAAPCSTSGRFADARRELEDGAAAARRSDDSGRPGRSDRPLRPCHRRLARRRCRRTARRYLAYTGAGRLRARFPRASRNSELPRCGPGLAPDDVAVIELFLTADGSVAGAMPIYASRQRPSAIALRARGRDAGAFDAEAPAQHPGAVPVRRPGRSSLLRLPHAGTPDRGRRRARPARRPPIPPGRARSRTGATAPSLAAARGAGPPWSGRDARTAGAPCRSSSCSAGARRAVPTAERESLCRRAGAWRPSSRPPPERHSPPSPLAIVGRAEQAQRRTRTRRAMRSQLLTACWPCPKSRSSPEAAAHIRLARARRSITPGRIRTRRWRLPRRVRALPPPERRSARRRGAWRSNGSVHAGARRWRGRPRRLPAIGPDAERCGLSPAKLQPLDAAAADFPRRRPALGLRRLGGQRDGRSHRTDG